MISRKKLEIRHSNSYANRGRLKQLGCEWDPIARAWIAPSLEAKELIIEELDNYLEDGVRIPHYGQCGWTKEFAEFTEKFVWGEDTSWGALPEEAKSIAHTPTKEQAIKIVGEGNVERYWRDDIPEIAAEILASGETLKAPIYDRLEDCGWKARSVSLMLEIVDHFREFPPVGAFDQKLDKSEIIAHSAVKPEEMQGSISIISDAEGTPLKLAVTFPYSREMVRRVKLHNLKQEWNPTQKRWEIPIKYARNVFATFPHFERSPGAKKIEEQT